MFELWKWVWSSIKTQTEGYFPWRKKMKLPSFFFFVNFSGNWENKKLIKWAPNFMKDEPKKKYAWIFIFFHEKSPSVLGHNWTSYTFSELKLKNSWNESKHKIFFDISLIFLCIFSHFLNMTFLRDYNF